MVRSVRLRSMLVGWFGLGESDFESLLRQVDVIEEKMAEVDTGLLLAGMMAAATASSTSSSGHEEEEHVGVEDDINVGNSNNKQHDVKSHHYSLSSSSSAISALASSLQLSSLHQKISSTATTPERVTSSGGFTSSTNNNNPIEINLGSIDFGNEDGDDETQVDDDEVDECLHVAQQYVMDAVESTRYAVMNKMGRIENSRSSTSHSVCRESGVAWTSAAMPMMEHDAPPLVSNMIPISTRGALFSNSPMLKDMMSSTDSSFSSLSRSWPLSSSLLSMGGGGGGSPERELDEYSSASSTQPQQQHQHQFSSHNPSPSMSPKTVVDQEINTYRNLHHSLLRSYGVSANTESNSNAGISNKSSGNRKRAIAVDDDLNGDLIDGDVSWASQVLIQK